VAEPVIRNMTPRSCRGPGCGSVQGIGAERGGRAGGGCGAIWRGIRPEFLATVDEGRIIAAVLCGHDGRRGLLHHLAVIRRTPAAALALSWPRSA